MTADMDANRPPCAYDSTAAFRDSHYPEPNGLAWRWKQMYGGHGKLDYRVNGTTNPATGQSQDSETPRVTSRRQGRENDA